MAESTVIDISPVRRSTTLATQSFAGRESGSGFNALRWAIELLSISKQSASSLRQISTTLIGIRNDNAQYEQMREESTARAREQLERQQEAGQDFIERRNAAPQRITNEKEKSNSNSLFNQIGSIITEWKNASYIGRGIMMAIRNVGKIFRATRLAITAIQTFLGVGGFAGIAAALSAAIVGAAWGAILYGILDKWGKAHKLFEDKKEEGRLGIAQDEAKTLGIKTTDETGAPKERKELAREVANKLQEVGQITPEDRKAAGIAEYKEGEGFTSDDATKLLEYRQKQRVKEKYGDGLSGSIGAALAGPPRESEKQKASAPASSSTGPSSTGPALSPDSSTGPSSTGPALSPDATAFPAWSPSTGANVIEGEGLPAEELLPSSTLPRRTPPAPSVTSTSPTRAAASGEMHVSDNMLAAIRSHEQGKAGYDSTLGNGAYRPGGAKDETQKPITNMTLGELYELQSAILRNPQNKWKSTAVGAYQFTRSTLFGERGTPDKPAPDSLVGKMGLTKNTKFTPELQDQLASVLVERRASQAQLMASKGNTTFESAFQTALSQEWASIKDVTGRGYYANQRGARTDIREFITPTRQAAPLQAGTAQLAQTQMQAPIVMAVNMSGGNRPAPPPQQTFVPVPVRPRTQDEFIRGTQTTNNFG